MACATRGETPASLSHVVWVWRKLCHEIRGSPSFRRVGSNTRLRRFFGLSGVPVRVLSARSSAFVRELAASLSLSAFLSDSLRGIMRLLLFVFGGPNPSE